MIGDYVHIGRAAEIMGVCKRTLVRWEDDGLIKVSRSSLGHRIYRTKDLPRILAHCYGRRAPARQK